MQKLELYHRTTCPYCFKVKNFIEENKIMNVTFKNISDSSEDYQALLKIGGKIQVPCLFIDGKPMYESEDIITWLKKNAVKQ